MIVKLDHMPDPTRKPRPYRGTSEPERVQARRARLIAAGFEVYGLVGYRRASVKAVCAAAGLTDRYFYESFDSSEALLAACFAAVTEDVLAIVARAQGEQADPMLRARGMLQAFFEVLGRERRRARVFLLEMAGISPDLDQAFDAMLTRVGGQIVEVLDPGREGPLARDSMLAHGVASGLVGIAMAWVRRDFDLPTELVAESALTLCALARPREDRPAEISPG